MNNTISMNHGQLTFFGSYTLDTHLAVLIAIVAAATVFDLREQRIPNWLVGFGAAGALAWHATSPFGSGALFALAGLVVGVGALMPLYALGAMGAGDAKLMGTVGAFLGSASVLGAVLATFIAGGILALAAAMRKRMVPQLVANLRMMVALRGMQAGGGERRGPGQLPGSVGKMPYALAIAAGTAIQIFFMRG